MKEASIENDWGRPLCSYGNPGTQKSAKTSTVEAVLSHGLQQWTDVMMYEVKWEHWDETTWEPEAALLLDDGCAKAPVDALKRYWIEQGMVDRDQEDDRSGGADHSSVADEGCDEEAV